MTWLIMGAVTSVVGFIVWLERRRFQRETRADLLRWVKLFPGRCPICAYQRWGYGNGFTKDADAAPHECPETHP